ncbi:MAG: hypothetical protein ACPGUV_08980 [Polyangiales bacterium]
MVLFASAACGMASGCERSGDVSSARAPQEAENVKAYRKAWRAWRAGGKLRAPLRRIARVRAPWMIPEGEVWRTALTAAGSAQTQLHLLSPHCYRIVWVTDSRRPVTGLLYDARSSLVAQDESRQGTGVLGRQDAICPTHNALFRIELESTASGFALVQLVRSM